MLVLLLLLLIFMTLVAMIPGGTEGLEDGPPQRVR
jgi:hypothetical protein